MSGTDRPTEAIDAWLQAWVLECDDDEEEEAAKGAREILAYMDALCAEVAETRRLLERVVNWHTHANRDDQRAVAEARAFLEGQ